MSKTGFFAHHKAIVNLNRWYDAEHGRWLNEDPIGFAAGDVNLTRYVGNNPKNGRDPDGLEMITVLDPGYADASGSSRGNQSGGQGYGKSEYHDGGTPAVIKIYATKNSSENEGRRLPEDAHDAFMMGLLSREEANRMAFASKEQVNAYIASKPKPAEDPERFLWQKAKWRVAISMSLEPNGAAAYMLEHSLQEHPSDLKLSADHFISKKIAASAIYQNKKKQILDSLSPGENKAGGIEMEFIEPSDLHLSLNKTFMSYEALKGRDGDSTFHATIDDEYDFHLLDGYRLGTIANNEAYWDQKKGVIKNYSIHAEIE